jgi:protein-L-isoaspartate O-methyltransferase
MFTKQSEKDFLFSHLNKDQKVLEYGSGESTLEISKVVKSVLSIEHQKDWYEKISKKMPNNVKLILKEPNLAYVEGGHCGTYEEFKDYVDYPLDYGPFDVIFIDGRARVSCASICNKISHENTLIFVHDFDLKKRREYEPILEYLDILDSCGTMYKFEIKK